MIRHFANLTSIRVAHKIQDRLTFSNRTHCHSVETPAIDVGTTFGSFGKVQSNRRGSSSELIVQMSRGGQFFAGAIKFHRELVGAKVLKHDGRDSSKIRTRVRPEQGPEAREQRPERRTF